MKLKLLTVTAFALFFAAIAIPQDSNKPALKNQDVVKMVQGGLAEETVIKSIGASKTDFDVSPDGLIALKNAAVSQRVIDAMIAASKPTETGKPSAGSEGDSAVTPKVSDGKAAVYFYRYKQYTGSFLEPSVFCDDVELARMQNGGYFIVNVEPGQHTFRSNDKQSGVSLNVNRGDTYYLRVEIATGFLKGHGRLVLTQPQQGQFEIQKLHYATADSVKDQRVQPKPADAK